ncbi:MAG: hypothetical protein ACREJX_09925 [Polyangiaceae bacterium]
MFIAAGCSTERTPQTPKVASPTPALPAVMPAAHDAGATMAAPDPAASTTAPVAAKDEPDSPPSSTEDPNPTIGVAIPPSVDADDVREAVFRHMFGQNASGIQQGSGVYCLEVENQRDPTAGFLSRMHDVRTPVKAVSKCSASADKGVIDKSTGKHGLIFRIESVAFKDGHHATVNGGYYEAGLSASGNIYTVELRGTTWVVTKDQMMWIS